MSARFKMRKSLPSNISREEPVLVAESKEEPKEEEHVSLVPNIDVFSLTKFEEVIPKVLLIGSSVIAS